MSRARGEEGVVLLLVLAVIVISISTVYTFARTSMLEIMNTRNRIDHARAELLARSGVPLAIRALVDDVLNSEDDLVSALDSSRDPWYALSETAIEVPGHGELRLTVRDAGNRINVNGLIDGQGVRHEESLAFLSAVLDRIIENMPGRREEKLYDPDELAEAIIDWIDADEQTVLGGDETETYRRRGGETSPPDRPLWTLAELSEVPGADPLLLGALNAYLTTEPLYPKIEQSGVNPNTAPPYLLAMIYHGVTGDRNRDLLDEEEVFSILRARHDGRIFCPGSDEERCVKFESEIGRVGETVFPPLTYRSDIFSIKSEARFGNARACLRTVVDRSDLREILTLSFRMGC